MDKFCLLIVMISFAFCEAQMKNSSNQQSVGSVYKEGPLYSSSGLCLDNWEIKYNKEMVGFNICNGHKTQQWKFLSNGQIVHNTTGHCIIYQVSWQELMLTNCSKTDQEQLWIPKNLTQDPQWMQFINTGYSKQKGRLKCLVQYQKYAELNDCKSYKQTQFFGFFPPPPPPPPLSPSPEPPTPPPPPALFGGPLKSQSLNQCLDNLAKLNGYEMLGFTDCNFSNSNQYWQYLKNKHLQQVSSGLCISYYKNWGNLMTTKCNESDLLQIWRQDCKDSYCIYMNKGYSQTIGYAECMYQDGKYAGVIGCDYYDPLQLFTFSHASPPAPSPSVAKIPINIIIAIIFAVIIFCLPFSKIIISKSVQWRNFKKDQQQQRQAGISTNLNTLDMMGLQDIISYQDSTFNNLPDWWSEISLPQGVREIPITDLKGMQRLGAGGFAVVYQAQFKECAKYKYPDLRDKQVALKIVFQEYLQIRDSMDAILKEVAAMSKLDNEHIVKLLGASLFISPSIVMELVPQGSLEDLLKTDGYKSHQTSFQWKLKLFLNISKGIKYLHSQNIIHRDLKPPNILIKDRDAAITKISDFGLAKIQQTQHTERHTKQIAGTRQYMAPDMFDMFDVIDEKVDIWALGVIMQEILRGVKPWQGYHENFIICKIINKQPPDSGDLPKQYPQDLILLIQSCWKTPVERPSAQKIVEKLETMLQTEYHPENISDQSSSQSSSSNLCQV